MQIHFDPSETRLQTLLNALRDVATDECMEWPRSTGTTTGYGTVRIDGKEKLVHRVVLAMTDPTFTDTDCALHRCDNRPCFNPRHLFKGSKRDNLVDMYSKGRGAKTRVHRVRHPAMKLDDDKVRTIRLLYRSGELNQPELARRFDMHHTTISAIICGKTWKHVKD